MNQLLFEYKPSFFVIFLVIYYPVIRDFQKKKNVNQMLVQESFKVICQNFKTSKTHMFRKVLEAHTFLNAKVFFFFKKNIFNYQGTLLTFFNDIIKQALNSNLILIKG